MAEEVGFEPTDGASPSLDFESSPFDHSGIPPSENLSVGRLHSNVKG